MYGLYGKFRTHDGKRDQLVELLLKAADQLQALEGCYLYVISADPQDEQGVWVTEVWASRDDHQASLELDAVRALIAEARPLIDAAPIQIEVEPVGGKGLPA